MTVIYYQDEEANIEKLERKKIRLKALVKKFKNDNEEYLKIEKKQSNRLQALYLMVKDYYIYRYIFLMESMRTDPQKI
jgi:hypothetical protein